MNSHAIRASYRLTCLGALLGASLGIAQAAGPAAVLRVYVTVVPPAQAVAMADGIKTWEGCLRDHKDKVGLVAYAAQTGDLDRYLFLEEHAAWADMDKDDAANKACAPTFRSEVLPHLSQGFGKIAVLNAKETHMSGDDPDPAPMLWIEAFRIKPGHARAFGETFAKYAAAAAKIHWQAHFAGYDIRGSGQGGEDFALVAPNKTWADVGVDPKPSVKGMMETVYGRAAARKTHEKLGGAIAEEWSDIWSYNKDLSYIPAK